MIVFDLDDTLYKESEYVDSGIRAVAVDAEEAGVMSAEEAYRLIKSAPNTASGFDLLAAKALSLDLAEPFDIQRMLAVYRYHVPQISLPEESRELLDYLKNKGINLGIITDGRSVTQRAKIMALGLYKYIPDKNILISQEVGADKHCPTAWEMMMRHNLEEGQFMYVGDNPAKDFYWPNRLGWQTFMLLDTKHRNIHPQIVEGAIVGSQSSARHTITTLSELIDMVTR